MSLSCLAVLVIPVYIDTVTSVIGAIGTKIRHGKVKGQKSEKPEVGDDFLVRWGENR